MPNKIDIVIVSYLRAEFTKICLRHLVERTKHPYRIILVVNGVWETSRDHIEYYKILLNNKTLDHLILLGENYGIHAAKNVALPLVQSKYYIDMDNDILVPDLQPDWMFRLENLMDKHPKMGAISLRPQVLIGRDPKEFDQAGDVLELPHVGAHGRIMRTDVVKKVRGWDKTWSALRNNEEKYIAGELKKENYTVGYATKLRCWHLFGKEGSQDPWGYPSTAKPADHGHREIWPPVNRVGGNMDDFDDRTWTKK